MHRNAVEPATCAVTSQRLSGVGRPLTIPPPWALSVCVTLTCAAASAGHNPGSTPATSTSAAMKTTTFVSGERSRYCGLGTGIANAPTSACADRAMTNVSTPAAHASIRPSVIIIRVSLPRRAPRAVRMPISRSRSTARASSRLATLKQASSSTSPMIAITPRRDRPDGAQLGIPVGKRSESCAAPATRLRPLARHVGGYGVEARLCLRRRDTGSAAREHEQQPRVGRRKH